MLGYRGSLTRPLALLFVLTAVLSPQASVGADLGKPERAVVTLTAPAVVGASIADDYETASGLIPIPRAAFQTTSTGRVVEDFAPVRTGPGAEHRLLWRLYEGTQVAVIGTGTDAEGGLWNRICLWNSHDGWLADEAISFEPYPTPPPPSTPTPSRPIQAPREPREPKPVDAPATVLADTIVTETPDGGEVVGRLAAGRRVVIEAWIVAANDRVRYYAVAADVAGWVSPGALALDAADPPSRTVAGRPIVEPLRGKGMWFVLDSREHGESAGPRVAAAAQANGLTHLYVEIATSRGGFFGAPWLDELLPAAQTRGISVIGSVYVWLDDLSADLDLALALARYRTPGGQTLDGLTADIEETLVPDNVQAFGELLRHHLGDDYLLVATTYPPGSFAAPRYPWAAIARSWNAVAPMAYWRQMRGRVLAPDEVYAYTQQAIAGVRELAGRPDLQVEMLGQLFELGRPRLLGPDPPTPAEVAASMGAARDAGAIGIAFFDWTRATPAHWETIATFDW